MTPFLKIATGLVEECLKDSKVTSAVKMRLAGLIAEKLREQYKAGMLRASVLAKDEIENTDDDIYPIEVIADLVVEAIRSEAEKEE